MTEYSIELNNGVKMPILGLGVYLTLDKTEMETAIQAALEAGYRSFDTAQMYHNEALLGEVLEETGFPREELFLTSKVDLENMGYEATLKSFEETLQRLRTDYLDLFLIHWPGQKKERLLDTWRAMEKLYKDGKVRAIGVCNCRPKHLEWIMDECEIVPVLNQVERNPRLNDKDLFDWCKERGIWLEAWRPLNKGNFDSPEIQSLAKKYNRTSAQIILRWDIQSDYIVIPKSVNPVRIFENANIFDFELEEQDMAIIDGMHTGRHSSHDPDTFDF